MYSKITFVMLTGVTAERKRDDHADRKAAKPQSTTKHNWYHATHMMPANRTAKPINETESIPQLSRQLRRGLSILRAVSRRENHDDDHFRRLAAGGRSAAGVARENPAHSDDGGAMWR
jgi:hypothetical protein